MSEPERPARPPEAEEYRLAAEHELAANTDPGRAMVYGLLYVGGQLGEIRRILDRIRRGR